MYWIVFVIATIAITEFFTAYKYIQANDPVRAFWVITLSLLAFFVSVFFMTYKIYAEEKDKDNLRMRFALFEMVYAFFNRAKLTKRGMNI